MVHTSHIRRFKTLGPQLCSLECEGREELMDNEEEIRRMKNKEDVEKGKTERKKQWIKSWEKERKR
jgi:hypothetical protein